MVDPKGDPGEHHDQDGRQVRLEHKVADVPLQLERQRQPLQQQEGCEDLDLRH